MRAILRPLQRAARCAYGAPRRSIYHTSLRLPGVLPAAHLRRQGRALLCSAAGKSKSFLLADIGEGIAEVEVLQWYIAEGQEVSMFDKICEVQSDKATVDISSKYDGVVTQLHYAVGDMAAVGAPLIDITVEDDPDAEEEETSAVAAEEESPAAATEAAPAAPAARAKAVATPAVRRIALEN